MTTLASAPPPAATGKSTVYQAYQELDDAKTNRNGNGNLFSSRQKFNFDGIAVEDRSHLGRCRGQPKLFIRLPGPKPSRDDINRFG